MRKNVAENPKKKEKKGKNINKETTITTQLGALALALSLVWTGRVWSGLSQGFKCRLHSTG